MRKAIVFSCLMVIGSAIVFGQYTNRIRGSVWMKQTPEVTGGSVFWVSSTKPGSDSAGGVTGYEPDRPYATLDYAIGQCTANTGCTIYVMANHAETVTAADGIDIDVAGVTIIGLGTGSNRPSITFTTATGADVAIDAADAEISGLEFICNIASQTRMIDITASGDGAYIHDNIFREGSATGLSMIGITGVANDVVIENNRFYAPTAGNYDEAIEVAAAVTRLVVKDNYIIGDFDEAGIQNPTGNVATLAHITGNDVTNLLTGQHAIQLVSAVIGMLTDNRLYADTNNAALDPGSMYTGGNLWARAIDENAVQIPATPYLEWRVTKNVTTAMTGGTPNDHGDHDGTGDPHTVFAVTGDVLIKAIWGVGNTTLVGATATIELGVASNTAKLIAQSTATNIADGDIWTDTGAETGADIVAAAGHIFINDGADIIETIGTANLTAGQMDYYVVWAPAEEGGFLVASD